MMRRIDKRNWRGNRGFTLVELIAVMIILGLLAGVVTVGINSQVKKAKIKAAITQISQLEQALSTFHLDCGFFPASLDGLVDSGATGRPCNGYTAGGYLNKKTIPSDPWGNQYSYLADGVRNPEKYDLWSPGPDGEEETEDDINNWASDVEEE